MLERLVRGRKDYRGWSARSSSTSATRKSEPATQMTGVRGEAAALQREADRVVQFHSDVALWPFFERARQPLVSFSISYRDAGRPKTDSFPTVLINYVHATGGH